MATKSSKILKNNRKDNSVVQDSPSAVAGKQAVLPFDAKVRKRSIITSFNNLSPEMQELLQLKYPTGWRNHVIKINKSNHDFFFAVTLDTPEVDYLIKVDVEIDSRQKLEEDRTIFGGFDDSEGDEDENEAAHADEYDKIADEVTDD
jgi:hypothetical protein